MPRDHVGQPAHDHAAGIEPDARFDADRGMLRAPNTGSLGIGVVELAGEQVPVLRQLELADAGAVLGEVGRDLRNFRRAGDEGVDRRGQMRLEQRPQPLQTLARLGVEPIGFQARRQFGVHFVLGHRAIRPVVDAMNERAEHAHAVDTGRG